MHSARTKLTLTLLLLFCSTFLISQDSPKEIIEFGNITEAEMHYSSCDFEPDAKAVILRDHGIIEFRESNNAYAVLMRHKLVKILDNSASDLGDVKIYYAKENLVRKIEAQSISPEGVKTPISKADIFYEKENEYVNSVRFAVSKLSAGSLLEFKYELEDINYVTLPEWEFQSEYPTIESNLIICHYKYLNFASLTQGAIDAERKQFPNKHFNFSKRGRNNNGATQYNVKNIPSIKEEKFVSNIENYRKKIRFQLLGSQFPNQGYEPFMSDWKNLSKEMLDNDDFGPRMNNKPSFGRALKALKATHPDIMEMAERERYKVIYNFVTENIECTDASGIFVERKLDKVFDAKVGDIDEINFMIIALAKQCDLEAYPALTSTHSHGKLFPDYPFYSQFNYAFVYVVLSNGNEILSDGSDHLLGYDVLPYHLYNDKAFIIKDKGEHMWKDIKSPTRISVTYLKGSLDEEGTLDLEYHITPNNIEAEDWRIALKDDEDYVKNYLHENHNDISITMVENKNVNNISEKLKIYAKCSFENSIDVSNDMIYFEPVISKFTDSNPFVAEERQMPIDFVLPFKEVYILNLDLPKNYTVESLPKSEVITLENKTASLTYGSSFENGMLTIRSIVEFKEAEYAASTYFEIKGMFEQIINKQSEMVVFKKI